MTLMGSSQLVLLAYNHHQTPYLPSLQHEIKKSRTSSNVVNMRSNLYNFGANDVGMRRISSLTMQHQEIGRKKLYTTQFFPQEHEHHYFCRRSRRQSIRNLSPRHYKNIVEPVLNICNFKRASNYLGEVWSSTTSARFEELKMDYERSFLNFKTKCEEQGTILPPEHPTTIRAESILREIINALNKGMKLQHECTVSGKSCSSSTSTDGDSREKEQVEKMCQDMFQELAVGYGTQHLEGRNWELLLVDSDLKENAVACYFVGTGKIIMSAKWAESYDIYTAYCLGHEVGHGVTLESQKDLMNVVAVNTRVWPVYDRMWPYPSAFPASLRELFYILTYIFGKWYTLRMELIAEYVGVMLMASAGYDPRYVNLCKSDRKSNRSVDNFFSKIWPSGEEVVNYLNNKIMAEAIAVYKKVKTDRQKKTPKETTFTSL